MSIPVPGGAPAWFSTVLKTIERTFVPVQPFTPIKLPTFQSDSLPDPTKYRGHIIWVADLPAFAVSDGQFWFSLTIGTQL